MSIPFRRVSNIDRSSIMAQRVVKGGRTSAANKENLMSGTISLANSVQPQQIVSMEEERVIRFAEPYSPEAEDFRPVPLPISIHFLEVSNGPPWSIGDDIEISRRKELDDPRQSQPDELQPETLNNFFIPSDTVTVTDHTVVHDDFVSSVLLVMEPSEETTERHRNFTHLKIPPETTVPLTYLRLKIPTFYRNLFLNEKSATHTLHLTNLRNEIAVMPVHDLVLVSQCLNIRQIITRQTTKTRKAKPALLVSSVPDLDSFGILLKWLYTNDEDELYEIISTSQIEKRELLCGFALNCRFWGIVDSRVTGVIRALLEDFGYTC